MDDECVINIYIIELDLEEFSFKTVGSLATKPVLRSSLTSKEGSELPSGTKKKKTSLRADEFSLSVDCHLGHVCDHFNIFHMANSVTELAVLVWWNVYALCGTSKNHLKQFICAGCSVVRTHIPCFKFEFLHKVHITKSHDDKLPSRLGL